MSVITRHPSGGESLAGKLASTLLSVAVAGIAEPGRFRRGKNYVLDNAVVRVEIVPGLLRAEVLGSRAEAYVTTVAVEPTRRPADLTADRLERHHASALVPDGDELLPACSCPDDDAPCKHAIAALLVFAQELSTRPQLLIEWRCPPADAPRPAVGARARTGRHLHLVGRHDAAPERSPEPWSAPEWAAFEGRERSIPDPAALAALVASLPAIRLGAAEAGGVDLAAVVRSAQQRVARPTT
jgi:hypothetical protein